MYQRFSCTPHFTNPHRSHLLPPLLPCPGSLTQQCNSMCFRWSNILDLLATWVTWGTNYLVRNFKLPQTLWTYVPMNCKLLFLAQHHFTALVQKYLSVVKSETTVILLTNYWICWYTEHSTSMKSGRLQNGLVPWQHVSSKFLLLSAQNGLTKLV